jgi:hypothetical protein
MASATADYVCRATRAVGERERREYDAFGPWTYEVGEPDEFPPRFDLFRAELAGWPLVAKVPYHVERRDALPGSDLYERLFAFGPEGLSLLSIAGDSIERVDLPYSRMAWSALSIELLDGRLLFADEGGEALELRFNAVSEPLARKIIGIVRPRILARRPPGGAGRRGEASKGPRPDLVDGPGRGDFHFANVLASIRAKEGPLPLAAYQAPCRIAAESAAPRSFFQGLRDFLRPSFLDSAMILELPEELMLLRSGKEARRRNKGYWLETTWLPLASVRGSAIEERALRNGGRVYALSLETGGGVRELLFSEPPAAALARIAELAGT